MNQKTLSIILGTIVVILIGVIIYIGLANKSNKVVQQPSPTPTQATQWPTPTPTPTPSSAVTNLGPMPKMTYKTLNSVSGQNNSDLDIVFYADGKQVAVLTSAVDKDVFGKVVFRAGNSSLVYFSIEPSGIGGYYIFPSPFAFNLYKLDLDKKAAEKIIDQLTSFDFNSSLTKIVYVSSAQIIVMDLATGAKEYFGKISTTNDSYQIGNVKFSPDLKKAAVAVGYGPANEYGEIYVLDFATKAYSLYKQVSSGHLQVNGWKSNTEVNWSNF